MELERQGQSREGGGSSAEFPSAVTLACSGYFGDIVLVLGPN